ncbi:putative transporter small subunit [Bordetella sp. 15P40C-2]|nr:putative transporter small subunit [Bordetella sp. 15P40C-2]
MLLTLYILVWPVISAAILAILIVALCRDVKRAKETGESMI